MGAGSGTAGAYATGQEVSFRAEPADVPPHPTSDCPTLAPCSRDGARPFFLRRVSGARFRTRKFPIRISCSRINLPAERSFSGNTGMLLHGSKALMSAAPVIYVTYFQIGKSMLDPALFQLGPSLLGHTMSRSVSRSAASLPHSTGTQFLEAAAHDCPHGLMIEQAGRVVYANPAYAQLAGFNTAASVLGKRVSELSISAPGSHANVTGNGGPPEFASTSMEFRRGRRSTLHVVRDVTEFKRLELRLRESQKMEALGRLVGGVAHDFNNVLTAITLYADLLLERTHRRREAEEIHLAAQRGTAIVRQLLTFARQQPLAPRLISLRTVITSMRGMLEPLLGENIGFGHPLRLRPRHGSG